MSNTQKLIEKELASLQGSVLVNHINASIEIAKLSVDGFSAKDISDGHHTFRELYEFRMMYNALLFNAWAMAGIYDVHKSWKHYDGEYCFGDSKPTRFIVAAFLPGGQITNHYKAEHWELFDVEVVDKSKFEFDGHTGKDILERMRSLLQKPIEKVAKTEYDGETLRAAIDSIRRRPGIKPVVILNQMLTVKKGQ